MNICHPETDLSCGFSPEEIAQLKSSPDDAAILERAEMLAWMSVERLSGYRVALCPTIIRPCARRCVPSVWVTAGVDDSGFLPYMLNGRWYNACGCQRADTCSCSNLSEIRIPGEVSGPITVTIDGAVLDPAAYRVDNGQRLVRLDGEAWPMCQDMSDPEGFQVSYYAGVYPEAPLAYAAGILTVEWFKSCKGRDCALPSSVTRVTRQGVSFDLATSMFDTGYSGIRAVDDIIGMYNPYRLKTPSRVISPDTVRYRQRTS